MSKETFNTRRNLYTIWWNMIHRCHDQARVGVETDDLDFDHEGERVSFSMGFMIDSLEPHDFANALSAMAEAIRKGVERG